MSIFFKTETGSVGCRSLELQILLADMIEVARKESDVDWIVENIQEYAEMVGEEIKEDMESVPE